MRDQGLLLKRRPRPGRVLCLAGWANPWLMTNGQEISGEGHPIHTAKLAHVSRRSQPWRAVGGNAQQGWWELSGEEVAGGAWASSSQGLAWSVVSGFAWFCGTCSP